MKIKLTKKLFDFLPFVYKIQFTGIIIWIFISATQKVVKYIVIESDVKSIDIIKVKLLEGLSYLIVVSLLCFIFKRIKRLKKSRIYYLFITLPLIFVLTQLMSLLENIFRLLSGYKYKLSIDLNFLVFSFYYIMPLFAFSALYFVIIYWQESQIQKEKALKAMALAQESQLKMLNYQINPHFLFNSLNTIRSLITSEKEKARDLLTQLSEYFRYTLSENKKQTTLLRYEIDTVEKYLSIQKTRFRENLLLKLDIDKNTLDIKIPVFIIHPLIENALKYGLLSSKYPLRIELYSKFIEKSLIITVKNSGKLLIKDKKDTKGTNTGIENIIQRLEILYTGRYSFSLSGDQDMVVAVLRIDNITK